MALRSAGSTGGLRHSLQWLHRVQNGDGGWGVVPSAASDADTTGAVLQTITAAKARRRGVSYLRKTQARGGGFRLGGGGVVNSQSTAWAVQGMIAAGVDPNSIRRGGYSGTGYLAKRQGADGRISYSRTSDQTPVWVTGEALVAGAGRSYPIAAVARKPAPAPKPADVTTTPGALPPP